MKTYACLALAMFLVMPALQSAQATPVLEYTSGSTATQVVGTISVGWSFTVNSSVTVTNLDSWAGGPSSTNVRLYNPGQSVLASATVTSSDPTEGSPTQFYAHTITPVVLSPGSYFIAEDVSAGSAGNMFQYAVQGRTTDPAITYNGGVSAFGMGATPTANSLNVPNGYFGPNFDIASVSTPEPASLAVLTSGIAAMGFIRRRRSRTPSS